MSFKCQIQKSNCMWICIVCGFVLYVYLHMFCIFELVICICSLAFGFGLTRWQYPTISGSTRATLTTRIARIYQFDQIFLKMFFYFIDQIFSLIFYYSNGVWQIWQYAPISAAQGHNTENSHCEKLNLD